MRLGKLCHVKINLKGSNSLMADLIKGWSTLVWIVAWNRNIFGIERLAVFAFSPTTYVLVLYTKLYIKTFRFRNCPLYVAQAQFMKSKTFRIRKVWMTNDHTFRLMTWVGCNDVKPWLCFFVESWTTVYGFVRFKRLFLSVPREILARGALLTVISWEPFKLNHLHLEEQ